jgi:hypothetical protein
MVDLNLTIMSPYPVHFITLKNQQQEMEYMDVKPDNYNGKHSVFMVKNFNGAYWQNDDCFN